jgi:hypothetical protein
VGVVDCHGECAEEGVLLFMSVILDTYQMVVFKLPIQQF